MGPPIDHGAFPVPRGPFVESLAPIPERLDLNTSRDQELNNYSGRLTSRICDALMTI
jgi:hypothetical protein